MLDFAEFGLKPGALVLLDTAPLVYLVEGNGDRAAVARSFAEAAREGTLRLAASVLVWTEGLTAPLAAGDRMRADAYRKTLADSSLVALEPVDVAIAEQAAALRAAAPSLAAMDALHLATALRLGADAVLTNDEAWRTLAAAAFPRGPRVLLVDELAFSLR